MTFWRERFGAALVCAMMGCGMAERFHEAGLWHQKAGRLALAQNELEAAAQLEPGNLRYQRALKRHRALREGLGGIALTSSVAVQAALLAPARSSTASRAVGPMGSPTPTSTSTTAP